jgi:Flp pilus assembly protein TadB
VLARDWQSGCGGNRRRQRVLRRRRAEQITAALPDVLELLAATVDGGAAPDLAVKRVVAFATEPLRSVLVDAIQAAAGVGLGASMRSADAALRPLGSLFQQSEELGVPIAGALRDFRPGRRRVSAQPRPHQRCCS